MAVFAWLSTNKSRGRTGIPGLYGGKIDVPEADAYMGKNQKNDIEEKKNSTVKTETKKDKQSENTINLVQQNKKIHLQNRQTTVQHLQKNQQHKEQQKQQRQK